MLKVIVIIYARNVHEHEKTYGSFEENDDIHELSKICILFPYLYVRKK